VSRPSPRALRLVPLVGIALLAACTSAGLDSPDIPTPAVQVPATPSQTSQAVETSVATSKLVDESRRLAPSPSVLPEQGQPPVMSIQEVSPESVVDPTGPTPLRLPVAGDLGPNYFEIFSRTSQSNPSDGPATGFTAAVVAFGFSERAKLRDERIERDGPLAAVARISRHASTESALRFAVAADAADAAGRLSLPATAGAAKPLGLAAEVIALQRSPPSGRGLALGLTATRTLRVGWFGALDGSRVQTVLEQWTAVRDRTVLTVLLVWGDRATDDWGRSLIQRLVQSPAGQAAPHAP